MISISVMNDREIRAAAGLFDLFTQLANLSRKSRQRVYQRWEMLHLIEDGDGRRWEREVKRVTKVVS